MEVENEDVTEGTEETVTEGAESTETTETTEGGEAEAEGTETPEAQAKAQLEAEAAEGEEETEEGEEESHVPVTKFKAGVWNKDTKQLEQREFEIDPKFHGIMKDAESEKLVRELHEKAFGLESIKERFNETRQNAQALSEENRQIVSSINGVRSLYQTAVKSGNLHKLDFFFQKLDIPQQVILQYALEKVKLNEMAPEQRQAVETSLKAEKDAEDLRAQMLDQQSDDASQSAAVKQQMVEAVLERPAVAALVEEYDTRVGKPGAFKAAVFREGSLAWNTERLDLTPQQAVQRVIENYGLADGKHKLPPGQQPGGAGAQNAQAQVVPNKGDQNPQSVANGGKKVVKRTDKTIPNVSGRDANSPLPPKFKSVDDIVKHRKEKYGA